ncbi:MAG: glycosyltransferase [Actinomycetota bacterium]|nr:glycosyltransferase [Actinomycetota bacterium]
MSSGVRVRAAVLAPATGAPEWVTTAGHGGQPLPIRVLEMARATRAIVGHSSVVDAHFPLYGLIPVVLARSRGIPVVVHFHGPWALESRVAGQRSPVGLAVKRAMEKAVQRRAGRLVTESAAFKQLLVESYGVLPWKVDIVPPGVDLGHFSPDRNEGRRRLGIATETRIVLAVRRLEARMGLDILLAAWAQTSSAHPDAQLVIVGAGTTAEQLRALTTRLGVAETVRFPGKVDEDTLANWYCAADFTVVPSLSFEGYGLVVLESAACGTPALVSDVGGLPEAAAGLGPDAVVPAGDVGRWAARLSSALDGTVPLPDSSSCRSYAERFSWERVAHCHDEVYEAAAKGATGRLKVVYVDHCAEVSGGELCLLQYLAALRDVDSHLVLGSYGPLVTRLHVQGSSVEVLELAPQTRGLARGQVGARLPIRTVLSTLRYVVRLTMRLRRLRPDLVHTNSLKASIYGGLAGRMAGIPVVWHIHDQLVPEEFPPMARRMVKAMARHVPSAIIANSESTLALLGPRLPPSTVVPSIIVSPRTQVQRAERVESRGLRVGIVGRLASWKGQHVFLTAFAQAFPHGDEEAVVVGAAVFRDGAYESELRKLALALGIEARVEFRGHRNDVESELRRLDVFVHASVTPEAFGRVIVEAMATGVPVIASRAGGPMEIVDDERTGILVTPGSVADLSAAMRRLAGSPLLRARLSEAAKASARTFDEQRVVNGVMKVYSDALEVRRR